MQITLSETFGMENRGAFHETAGCRRDVIQTSQVILFGAEFTRIYAKFRSSPLEPKENALRINRKGHA